MLCRFDLGKGGRSVVGPATPQLLPPSVRARFSYEELVRGNFVLGAGRGLADNWERKVFSGDLLTSAPCGTLDEAGRPAVISMRAREGMPRSHPSHVKSGCFRE